MVRERIILLLAVAAICVACQQPIPKEALELQPESLQRRQLQTRVYPTDNEAQILSASIAVLQDLGFTVTETSAPLGLVVGDKKRDATEAAQVIGAVMFALLFGVPLPVDKDQTIRVSVVTRPLTGERSGMATRATFQRVVRNTRNEVSKIEGIDDPLIYQAFFNKLLKAVFLEAQQI